MKIKALIWKSEFFGPNAPHIAVELASGTYGLWVALFDSNGRATGAARPVGSGCRLTRAGAENGARRANAAMGGPSATGAFQMGGARV